MAPPEQSSDSLAVLEDKIRRTVELVTQLRRERDAALASAGDSAALKTHLSELTREVETLRADRDTVRGRIGKLLEQIDSLSAP
ncbi:MAG: cell division protein ZapB [Acidobacteriia bacterium]|nr:cell division protein ZapB [Terriglobia bacterium]